MATAYDAVSSATVGSNTVLSWTHTTGAGDNRVVVVSVHTDNEAGGTPAISAITYGGNAMTLIATQTATLGAATARHSTYYYIAPAESTAATVSVTVDRTALNIIGGAVSYIGADQKTPITNSAVETAQTVTTTGSLVINGSTQDLVQDSLALGGSGLNPTEGADQTERLEVSGSTAALTTSTEAPAGGTATMTYSWDSSASYMYQAFNVSQVHGQGFLGANF